MKDEDYGAGYRYDHDEPDAFSGQDYFPEKMGRQTFYDPPERGFEREIRKRLDYWAKIRREQRRLTVSGCCLRLFQPCSKPADKNRLPDILRLRAGNYQTVARPGKSVA